MYACMHVCMYACMHVCTYACMPTGCNSHRHVFDTHHLFCIHMSIFVLLHRRPWTAMSKSACLFDSSRTQKITTRCLPKKSHLAVSRRVSSTAHRKNDSSPFRDLSSVGLIPQPSSAEDPSCMQGIWHASPSQKGSESKCRVTSPHMHRNLDAGIPDILCTCAGRVLCQTPSAPWLACIPCK